MSGFVFKQFTVEQTRSAMKVSTDGILLGAWAELANAKSLLDIGTGTGLLALMAKQRAPKAKVVAIEVDGEACIDAKFNFANSPWPEICLHHGAIQSFQSTQPFDVIITNPPYFNASLKGDNEARNTARHTDGLGFSELIECCTKLSHANTLLNVILPCKEASSFIEQAKCKGWNLARMCNARTTLKKSPSRSLMLFSLQPEVCQTSSLTIHAAEGGYSDEYVSLCKDFYLKM